MLLGDKDLMVNEVGVQNEKWLVDRLKKAPFTLPNILNRNSALRAIFILASL